MPAPAGLITTVESEKMRSNEIYAIIERLAATSAKSAKEALLREHGDDEEFRKVLMAALNPLITYGIADVPLPAELGTAEFSATTWRLLEDLSSRSLSGDMARAVLRTHLSSLSPESADLLARIVMRDLRAGIGDSTVNKATSVEIPEFPYMRCSLPKHVKLSQFDWEAGVLSQEKADGMFVNVNHYKGLRVQILSRQGSEFPLAAFDALVDRVQNYLCTDTQTHGELLVFKAGAVLPREQSNGVLNSVLQGGSFASDEEPRLVVWDQIPLSAVRPKGRYDRPYDERLNDLGVLQIGDAAHQNPPLLTQIATYTVHSLDEAYKHYAEMLAKGKEGTIIKDPRAIWRDGTSKQQVKLKLEVDVDLRIKRRLPGTGKNAATFGSIVCETACGQLEVAVTGMSDAKRKEINDRWAEIEDKVATVRANSIMVPAQPGELHSLFLPRFVEVPRLDKRHADTLEDVRAQFEAAMRPV
jgi:DNA ligase-1